MISFKTISPDQARASESFAKTKAGISLRWLHAGHSPRNENLRMHSALRSLGTLRQHRPRNVAELRAWPLYFSLIND